VTTQVFAEAAYERDFGATAFTPFANLALVGSGTTGYTEGGAGPGRLTVAPSFNAAAITSLGVRVEHEVVLDDTMLVTLSGAAAWRHVFGNTPTISNTLPGGVSFIVAGAPMPADTLVLEAGADLDVSDNLTLGFAYSGALAASSASHALTATLTGKF
jgi:outer membrane autotransporter protein